MWEKNDKQRRHSDVIKKFGTLLYIFAGSMTYKFIHKNVAQALPSLRTIQTIVQSDYSKVEEGAFRFDELLQHLKKCNSPLVIAVAEDATRIIKRVEYDSVTDRCVGFVLPCNENGVPQPDTTKASSFKKIEEMFREQNYAYLYSATSIMKGVPSFSLACIGSDNKFTSDQVLLR